ncbi:hypothetical protein EJB05_37915, partial [Eragrostis curvula]
FLEFVSYSKFVPKCGENSVLIKSSKKKDAPGPTCQPLALFSPEPASRVDASLGQNAAQLHSLVASSPFSLSRRALPSFPRSAIVELDLSATIERRPGRSAPLQAPQDRTQALSWPPAPLLRYVVSRSGQAGTHRAIVTFVLHVTETTPEPLDFQLPEEQTQE